jgi:phosphoglucomutase
MATHPLAGQPAPPEDLIDPDKLLGLYYDTKPDPKNPNQRVAFGTSGHRGTSLNGTFTEAHILATTQAICDYRRGQGITGPVMLGKDTHALSAAAEQTALEVLAANGVEIVLQEQNGFTPTPTISHAILVYNRGRKDAKADGIIITPSHNPPEDGGFKYNPPEGGPAEKEVTNAIQDSANRLLEGKNREVKRVPLRAAMAASGTHTTDFAAGYIEDLSSVIDMDAIRSAGLNCGVDALGGASLGYWQRIAERFGLKFTTFHTTADPRFAFMTLDHDGRIRMDCSSPWAMASLVKLRDQFDIAWACDPDSDRHGIVTKSRSLLNPNQYLAVAIDYLLKRRGEWPAAAAIGKTMVSSSMIDRVVAARGRKLKEVPVGFKWFAPGLFDGACCFGGEESAGASFLRRNGKVWTTDKDGLILGLLAAEICATTQSDPGAHYSALEKELQPVFYERIDTPATKEQKVRLQNIKETDIDVKTLAGDQVLKQLVKSPEGAALEGIKVITAGGWFAARPSGTEDIIKLYAESYRSAAHLIEIQHAAQELLR